MPLLLESARLIIAEAEPEQLEELLEVFLSQPNFLELSQGTAGRPGLYDLSKLQRDGHIARITPGRHMLGVYVKPSQAAVGVLDFMEESPRDGRPWLGLLLVHAEHQRRGYGQEVLEELVTHGREQGWTVLRAGVLASNAVGLDFARKMGFRPVAEGHESRGRERAQVLIMELPLSPRGRWGQEPA